MYTQEETLVETVLHAALASRVDDFRHRLVALFRRLGSTEEAGLRLVFAACLALLLPMIVAAVRLFPARKGKVTT